MDQLGGGLLYLFSVCDGITPCPGADVLSNQNNSSFCRYLKLKKQWCTTPVPNLTPKASAVSFHFLFLIPSPFLPLHPDPHPNAMEPFAILEAYKLLVCTNCHYACLVNEVPTHLRQRHKALSAKVRARIVQAIRGCDTLLRSQNELAHFSLPATAVPALPQLEGPFPDGLQCTQCPYIVQDARTMQEHCRTQHCWTNPRKRGGRVRARAAPAELPWRTGVWSQRFFRGRAASGLFEASSRRRPSSLLLDSRRLPCSTPPPSWPT